MPGYCLLGPRIGLVSRLDETEALRVATSIYRSLSRKGFTVFPETQFARASKLDGGKSFSEMDVDLIVTVGGDGTVLKTCMSIPKPETPILAVNMGRRGYLTEVEPKDAVQAVQSFLKGKCRLEERSKLTVSSGQKPLVDGLNETVITSATPSKMVDFRVSLDRSQLLEFRADGLIVATPTGSTAYALSAGGPILDTSLEAFVLAFICPLERMSPVVVPMSKSIDIDLISPRLKATVMVDGRYQRELTPQSSLTITKSRHKAVFARLGEVVSIRRLMRLQPLERAAQ